VNGTLAIPGRISGIAKRRAVLWRLIRSDLSAKYEGSTLGYMWSVLEPILLTAVYFFVFSVVGLRTGRADPFDLFLLSGILPWQWVTGTVQGSLRSLRNNRGLITKVVLPREIFPLSVVSSKGVEFLLSLFVLAALAGIRTHAPSTFLFAFPLAILMQLTLLTGVGLILSAANTLLRDIERVINPLIRALFYLSGILYPISLVSDKITQATGDPNHVLWLLYRLNPVIGILQLYRAVWFPDEFQGWATVGYSAVGCVILLVIGWRMFRRLEGEILKEL
jgi:ABC-2 type transport system permease protein